MPKGNAIQRSGAGREGGAVPPESPDGLPFDGRLVDWEGGGRTQSPCLKGFRWDGDRAWKGGEKGLRKKTQKTSRKVLTVGGENVVSPRRAEQRSARDGSRSEV